MNNHLVITIEGVCVSLLGAYGADNAQTPAIDRLASESLLLDRCYVDSQDPAMQLRSLWTGQHALQTLAPGGWSVWQAAADAQCQAALVTDCPHAAELAQQLGCPSVTRVDIGNSPYVADDPLDCAAVSVFAAAAEELLRAEPDTLLWVHSRGLRNVWDAPLALRERFMDPEDPIPPAEIIPPDFAVTADTDPDWVVGWAQVAAAQTSVLDEALGVLFAALETREDAQQWNTLLATLGGVPLGEHGHVGWSGLALRECQLACAAMLKTAGSPPVGIRRSGLCQLPDVAATLAELLRQGKPPEASIPAPELDRLWGRSFLSLRRSLKLAGHEAETHAGAAHSQALVAAASHAPADPPSPAEAETGETWIRTPAWSASLRDDSAELYVMPDDRWEVCDVARRREDVLDLLRTCNESFRHALAAGDRNMLLRLDEDLWCLMR